ncbi:MAG: hypothetical protein WA786_10670 [Acidimicrobiales bacterium]
MTTTHEIRLWSIKAALLSVLLITGLLAVVQSWSPVQAASVAMPMCADTQLTVSGVAAPGGSLHAGLVIHYKNVSATACSLTGYSSVVGINFETEKSRAAGHIRDGYLGGWMGYKDGEAKPLPLVVLRARNGAASSMVQWADGATAQQPGCSVLTSLWVNVPGGSRPIALKEWMLVCGYFDGTPIVPGATGSAH